MKDYETKKLLVEHNIDYLMRQLSYSEFMLFMYGEQVETELTQSDLLALHSLSDDELRVVNNLNNARYKRIKRAKEFIQKKIFNFADIMELEVKFITLTFSDETLKNTTELSRRKRVRRLLDKNCYNYIANIDFGEDNGREHYHAVAVLKPDANFKRWEQKNGFYKLKPVRTNELSKERLSKYLNKLTLHAFKDSTQHNDSAYRSIFKAII